MISKDFKEIPRSETTISQKLADIQKRCSELMQESTELDALSLEDAGNDHEWNNPYGRG